jgi:hypothetical protein
MKAIVSLANDRGNYQKALERLGNSLIGRFDGDFFGFTSESQIGAPPHLDNPYAFKIYAIEKVREQGYTQILWLDSSVYAIRDTQPIFDEMERLGYIMQEAGCHVGTWCNDFTLDYFGITREEANKMLCYGNAGFLGLNFNNELAVNFFKLWKYSMEAGCFNGTWDNHRHDLTCGSIIANKLDIAKDYKSGNEWLEYAAPFDPPKNDTIILKAQGL